MSKSYNMLDSAGVPIRIGMMITSQNEMCGFTSTDINLPAVRIGKYELMLVVDFREPDHAFSGYELIVLHPTLGPMWIVESEINRFATVVRESSK